MPSGAPALTLAFSGAKQKPVLDESSFQQLLAAAYVVQQHNDSLWTKLPQLDTARLLAEISDMQAQASRLELPIAAKLITERLFSMIAATGVSLSLIKDGYLDCLAESGVPAKVPGSSIASHSLVATERLKAGEVFESGDSHHDIRLDANLCDGLAVGSLIAAPVVRFGQLTGLIEVRWARPHAFEETGVFACRLMASLVTGILEREALPGAGAEPGVTEVVTSSESVEKVTIPEAVTEVSANQAAIKTKSTAAGQLTLTESEAGEKNSAASASVDEHGLTEPADSEGDQARGEEISPNAVEEASANGLIATAVPSNCRICGQPLRANESFCGHCSMPRAAANPNENLQSKWASLWFIQQAKAAPGINESENENEALRAPVTSKIATTADSEAASSVNHGETQLDPVQTFNPNHQFSYFEPVMLEHDAASEMKFWERAAAAASTSKSALRKLRAKDIALIIVASVLAVGVISAWPSNGRLTWFGSMMVRMGLARHSVPAFAGNPAVNVWVDEQTSLYYCPGEDRYGSTSAGHFTTQLEAEQSQLHPGSGLVCH
jgi:hypothetical protein